MEKKNLLLNIIQGIGLLIVFLFCYYGLNYIYKGNMAYSIAISILILIVLAGLVLGMNAMLKKKENTGFTIIEGICIISYIGLAIVTTLIMTHYINIEYLTKNKIKDTGEKKLEIISEMLGDYEDQVNDALFKIEGEMNNAISRYQGDGDFENLKSRLGIFDITLNQLNPKKKKEVIQYATIEKNNKIEADSLRALTDFSQIKSDNQQFIADRLPIFQNWESTKLHRTFYEVENSIEENLAKLKEKFKAPDSNKSWNKYAFEYEIPPREDYLISDPQILREKYNPDWKIPIIVACFIHLLILLPYLLSSRIGARRFYRKVKIKRGIDL